MDTNNGAGEEVISHGGKRETYGEFVEKFKPKKTTDDCMTPPAVYEVVADWVANEYGLDRADFVRPFWPGGDFENFEYPEGCVVVDNPPFSLMSGIRDFYIERGIDFFLFAPALVIGRHVKIDGICVIAAGASIEYENGAKVETAFLTNLEKDVRLKTAPELCARIKAIYDEQKQARALPKYAYPDNIVTMAIAQKLVKNGIPYSVKAADSLYVHRLDSMKPLGKAIYGGGLLLSDEAAAEKAAAEKAAAEKAAAEKAAAEKAAAEKAAAIEWQLSDRERDIIANLGKPKDKNDDE